MQKVQDTQLKTPELATSERTPKYTRKAHPKIPYPKSRQLAASRQRASLRQKVADLLSPRTSARDRTEYPGRIIQVGEYVSWVSKNETKPSELWTTIGLGKMVESRQW